MIEKCKTCLRELRADGSGHEDCDRKRRFRLWVLDGFKPWRFWPLFRHPDSFGPAYRPNKKANR